MVPGHRVIFTIPSAGIAAFINCDQHVQISADPFEIIQFIKALPHFREVCGCDMVSINYVKDGFLLLWMIFEISAVQLSEPWPVIFRICGRMQAQISAAFADKLLECLLLLVIQYIACSA